MPIDIGTDAPVTPSDADWAAAAESMPRLLGMPRAARRKIRSELSKIVTNTRRSKLLCAGDSTDMGYGANAVTPYSGVRAKAPAAVMAARLIARGIPARSDAVAGDNNVTPNTLAAYTLYNPDITFGAGWSLVAESTIGCRFFTNVSGTDGAVFTPRWNADRFDIWYRTGSGRGEFTVTDASGTLATVATTGSIGWSKVTVSRAVASKDPISIQRNGVGAAIGFSILDPWNSTLAEACIINGGVIGWATSNWIEAGNPWSPLNAIGSYAPDLTFINLGLNDMVAGVSLATMQTNLSTIIDKQVTTSGAGSVILQTPNPATSGDASNIPNTWKNMYRALARTKEVAFLDVYGEMVSREADTALFYDAKHLSAAGSAFVGSVKASALQ